MLYIDSIDNNSIRFGDAVGGGTYPKIYSKNLMARKDEIDRIWINNIDTGEAALVCALTAEITLAGSVYGTAALFVVAFNNLCSSGGASAIVAASGGASPGVYNTPGSGTVNNVSETISANTINSITIICIGGQADITINGVTTTILVGESWDLEGTGLIDSDIVIDATGGAGRTVHYITMGAATTTTTTAAVTTTTTSAAVTTTTTTA